MPDLSTADVLRQAKALIVPPEKWTTGDLCDSQGRMCAVGAVGAVLAGDPETWHDEHAIYVKVSKHPAGRALAMATGLSSAEYDVDPYDGIDAVWVFNDDVSAGHHAVVLDLFDRAIVLAESK